MAEEKQDVDELLDRLLEGKRPEEIVGGGGLLEDLTKRLLERALEGELTDHLGYEKHATLARFGPPLHSSSRSLDLSRSRVPSPRSPRFRTGDA